MIRLVRLLGVAVTRPPVMMKTSAAELILTARRALAFFSDSRSRPNGIVLEHHYFDLLWAFAVGFGYLQRDQTLYKLYNKSTADRRTQQIEVMTFARK